MTRPRWRAPGPDGPRRRRSLPILPLIVALALALVACGGGDAASPRVPRTATPVGSGPAGEPGSSLAPGASDPGTASEAPTDEPSEASPTEEPEATDAPSTDPGAASDCAGNDDNRAFYVDAAGALDWPVYCPVLGSGWFVESGQYRRAGGGWLEISYRGPAGARIALREGVPCSAAGCVPTGDDLGPAAFGDLDGSLLDLGAGGYAVVVDPGATPSWTITGSGLDQATFEGIAAALVQVAD